MSNKTVRYLHEEWPVVVAWTFRSLWTRNWLKHIFWLFQRASCHRTNLNFLCAEHRGSDYLHRLGPLCHTDTSPCVCLCTVARMFWGSWYPDLPKNISSNLIYLGCCELIRMSIRKNWNVS